MKKIFSMGLLLIVALAFAETYPPIKQVGQPTAVSTHFPPAIGSFQTSWQGTKAIYAFNGSGGTLAAGDLVVWDNTAKTVVTLYDASAAGAGTYDTCTIADSIKTYKWYQTYVYFSSASNDSIVLTGLDSANVSQTDTIIKASGTGNVYSTNYWRKISLAVVISCNDSIGVITNPYMTINTTTTAGDKNVAGVIAVSAADDSIIKVYIEGVASIKLAGVTTEVTPGAVLVTHSTAKYGIPSADIGPCFGYALESGNTNASYTCFINPVTLLRYKYGTSVFPAKKTADTVVVSDVATGDHVLVTPIGVTAWTTAPTGNVLGVDSIVVYCAEADTAIARTSGYNYLILD